MKLSKATTILGIDPSLNETAVAVLVSGVPSVGRLVQVYRIRPEGDTLHDRACSLANELASIIEMHQPGCAVLELPADAKRGGWGAYKGRSPLSIAPYGIAVGAAVMVLKWHLPAAVNGGTPVRVFYPSVNDWTGRGVPSSKGDPNKVKRANFVRMLYRLGPEALGPKTVAGNAADAVLLARWGLLKLEVAR